MTPGGSPRAETLFQGNHMDTGFDLLGVVLPPEGRYCTFGNGYYRRQEFWDTREQVEKEAAYLCSIKFDAYFACAKFGPEPTRQHRNALYFRALWMDLDCGPTKGAPDDKGVIKGYFTQQEAASALQGFCTAHNLPTPVVVDSGYGLHIYWVLTETVDRPRWMALAKALCTTAQAHGLIVDSSAFEASRVLRIPGTLNFKAPENPRTVAVLMDKVDARSYDEWKSLLKAAEPVPEPTYLPKRLSPLMESLSADRAKSFRKIMLRSANNDGCAQLVYAYQNQATVEYPLWRAALSIPAFCEDRDFGIHMMSQYHPEYDPGQTEQKANDIGGPYTCATFEKINPTGCQGCALKGKIKSPITLGAEIVRQAVEPEPPGDTPETVVPAGEGGDDGAQPATPPSSTTTFILADAAPGGLTVSVPYPYIVGQSGAVYESFPGEEREPSVVYEHPLHVIKRMLDPVLGEVALLYLRLPRDGSRQIVLPLSVLAAKDKARDLLAQVGVMTMERAFMSLQKYLMLCVKNLQLEKKAEVMHLQFGWAKEQGQEVFIVGTRAYTANDVYYSPPSSATKTIAPLMDPVGSLEKWREVFDMYAHPGLEAHAFAALVAFGAPLFRYTGLSGAIVNLIHKDSGTGKSTALYMCNSVWGNPRQLALTWKDTMNSKMHRLGVMNNLPVTVDEVTNLSAQDFSNFAYSVTQGRGANRMKASTNEERLNMTVWQTILLLSSNASFYQKLSAVKASPDGEMMRMFEYHIPPTSILDPEHAKQMFDHQLLENYGHAGPVFIRYVMNAEPEVAALIKQVQTLIDRKLKMAPKERFWSAIVACVIAGGLIAQKACNLHSYDMQAILDWACDAIESNRFTTVSVAPSPEGILGEFLAENINSTLVIKAGVPSMKHMPMAEITPKHSLNVRYEPDVGTLYVRASVLKTYCAEKQIDLSDMVSSLHKMGIYTGARAVRMGKGLMFTATPVHCYVFNTKAGGAAALDDTMNTVLQVVPAAPAATATADEQGTAAA